ncbi:class I SAM-dependent methyltransferase [Actinocorallia longicatena]|uniref:Class I SAM-dependent methyltransferase n=1 Tax=Actinocorallia longicatena TaxID=111803 RepID=A0ABP6QQ11_9ACTN
MSDVTGRWRELNRACWDERVPIHVGGDFYDLDGFRNDPDVLRPFEREEVGDVTGRTLVHLQCHFGLDTLSWATRGASVTGLDFSEPAIAAATRIARETGIDARFVAADVYDAAEALGTTYDIVYTGLGALNWLPDLTRWAETAAGLVAPGGFLYLAEFHPFTHVFDDETGSRRENDYFKGGPTVWDEPGTYADLTAETRHNVTVEWDHTLGDVVSAITATGLRLEFLHEHDYTLFPRYRTLERGPGGIYTQRGPRVPMMYSLRAVR